jgi:hypothetical protein
LKQLADEPGLADAGNAHDRHELRRAFFQCPLQRVVELVEFSPSADE